MVVFKTRRESCLAGANARATGLSPLLEICLQAAQKDLRGKAREDR